MRRLVAGSAALALAATALGAPAAEAATTIGSTPPGTAFSGPYTILQVPGPSHPGFVVPAGHWVLLSTSALIASDDPNPYAAAVVARPQGAPGEYKIIRVLPFDVDADQSATIEQSPSLVPTPVQGGDVLGLSVDDAAVFHFSSTTGAEVRYVTEVVAEGTTVPFPATASGLTYSVSAQLEPDADQDGYGDETQDACASDPTRQTACVVPPSTCPLTKKKAKALKGATLRKAKRAVKKAGCTVGDVKRPKKVAQGKVLRVAKVTVDGLEVDIRLKAVRKAR